MTDRELTGSPDALVTSVRLERYGPSPGNYRSTLHLSVYVRGKCAGTLAFGAAEEADANEVARRLMGVERCTETP